MWTKEIFGTDVYHLISAFIIYSMMGWLVESIYMSWCNRKLTNRGFARGPFCPIYGFGGVLGYLILHPLGSNPVALYLAGAFLATLFEYIVGRLMLRMFGEVWWDYNEKPCNFQGIICLESTIAWGFYAIIIITFLHSRILGLVDRCNMEWGIRACKLILLLVTIDYIAKLMSVFNISIKEQKERIVDVYHSIRARWY
ncbi:MAG: putative ABC transporter permease [Lachnospiraceae bacterium]|nr:putative ABC transporter permease [Lachnospiraceae bacterium]MDE6185235.1 putative ABC transporter permease [Lachnospiraceae bacterium]MDE7286968.1 putative ABC transporter permease [Lachnospiraceae bacterium]